MDKTDKKVQIHFWYIVVAVLGMMSLTDRKVQISHR
jgi:hypothetical protein